MKRSSKKARVRVREGKGPEFVPDFLDPEFASKDRAGVGAIQNFAHEGIELQAVSDPNITLNGKPVKILVDKRSGKSPDPLDYPEMLLPLDHPSRPCFKLGWFLRELRKRADLPS